jgi:hypothetical protein
VTVTYIDFGTWGSRSESEQGRKSNGGDVLHVDVGSTEVSERSPKREGIGYERRGLEEVATETSVFGVCLFSCWHKQV